MDEIVVFSYFRLAAEKNKENDDVYHQRLGTYIFCTQAYFLNKQTH